jgi:hypothetical protein
MAFSNIDNLNLGKFLQIAFSEGVRSQISEDYRDWEYVKRARTSDPDGRELRFLFQKSYGPAAVQYRNPNGSTDFPDAQQITVTEHTAVYKEVNTTIQLEYQLWDRARRSPAKYAEPLALEIQSKTTASKRRMAADLYGDGTGVVGETASTAAYDNTEEEVEVTLQTGNADRGHIGFFEFGDILINRTSTGTAPAAVTGASPTFLGWRVKSKDRKNDKVTLEPVLTSGAVDTAVSDDGIADNDIWYRIGQPTQDTNLTTFSGDFGTVSEVYAGLESLTASDGRTIHGITMSGATAGTTEDAGGAPLDVSQLQTVMDAAKINVGRGAYSWKMMTMAPESHAAFIESRETDRRFNTKEDAARGIKVFGYQHDNDFLESYTTEYCPKKRLYCLPEAKGGNKVLEYWGTDFEPVRMGGMGEFHLRPSSSGGYERNIVSFMQALCVLICKHPAAIARLENFTT